MKLRYILRYVSLSDFDSQLRQLKNQAETFTNNIAAMVCFAKDDVESVGIGRKISEAIESGSHDIIFIDATTTPFGKDGYIQYRDDMAQSDYQQGKDNSLSTQFANTARDSLKKWKNRISSGEFIVFSADKPSGERATSLDALYGILEEINRSEISGLSRVNLQGTSDDVHSVKSEARRRMRRKRKLPSGLLVEQSGDKA